MNFKAVIQKIASWFRNEAKVDIEVVPEIIEKESQMDATQTASAATASANNINTAVQIALALKAIDASLSVDAIQAGTNAALVALYPVATA